MCNQINYNVLFLLHIAIFLQLELKVILPKKCLHLKSNQLYYIFPYLANIDAKQMM